MISLDIFYTLRTVLYVLSISFYFVSFYTSIGIIGHVQISDYILTFIFCYIIYDVSNLAWISRLSTTDGIGRTNHPFTYLVIQAVLIYSPPCSCALAYHHRYSFVLRITERYDSYRLHGTKNFARFRLVSSRRKRRATLSFTPRKKKHNCLCDAASVRSSSI